MKTYLLIFFIFFNISLYAQNVSINDDGALPNGNAMLHISSTTNDKGIIIPRMTSIERGSIGGLVAADEGLTVYDETTNSYWLYDGSGWVEFTTGNAGWKTTGNGSTVAGTNYIGTTDGIDLVFKTNGNEDMRLESGGFFGVNVSNPNAYLDVASSNGTKDAIVSTHTSGSVAASFAAVEGVISNAGYTDGTGYLGYHNTSNKTFSIFGTGGDLAGYFIGKIGVNSVTTDIPAHDIEIRSASGSGLPSNIILRRYTDALVANTEIANIDFGDENLSVAQAKIQVLREMASDNATDLPTSNGIHTTNDGAAAPTEKVRITNKGQIETYNTGSSVFIGENAGNADDLTSNQNVFIGFDAGKTNSTGQTNVALGVNALELLESGNHNVAIGATTLTKITNVSGNVAIGQGALSVNTQAQNVAIGFRSLYTNSTGQQNTAVGTSSLNKNTSGHFNTAMGIQALKEATTARNNCAFGVNSMGLSDFPLTGWSNTAMGFATLSELIDGELNTALGYRAMILNESGDSNTFVGSGSAAKLISGGFNVGMGQNSLQEVVSGNNNTGYGSNSLVLATGSSNIGLGYDGGANITSGSNNIALGNKSYVPTITGDNQLVIGNLIYGTGLDGSGNTLSTGNIGIGVTDPDEKLEVVGAIKTQNGTSSTGSLILMEDADDGSNYLTLQPQAMAADVTLTFPADDGTANQALVTDGAGNLSWKTGSIGLIDEDGDTQIQLEEGADDDIIRFDLEGIERFKMEAGSTTVTARLEVIGNGSNIYIGNDAGILDQLTGVPGTEHRNLGIGDNALQKNTTGRYNLAIGNGSLGKNTVKGDNLAIGSNALANNIEGYSNVAIGQAAMYQNDTGIYNVVIGSGALYSNISGSANCVLGFYGLRNNQRGDRNIAIGEFALHSNVVGSGAVAIGYRSQQFANSTLTTFSNTNISVGFNALRGSLTAADNTGNYNTSIGYQSMLENTEGSNNVVMGYVALSNNTTGSNNVALGKEAMLVNEDGSSNTAIGADALELNTSGGNNVSIGAGSMDGNTTGSFNIGIGGGTYSATNTSNNGVAVGYAALGANTSGAGNTAIGKSSMTLNQTGANNTAVGINSLDANVGGADNTAIGRDAMSVNSSGGNNVALGSLSMQGNLTGSYNIAIGDNTLNKATDDNSNIAIGHQALQEITLGGNAAVGDNSNSNNTGGTSNVSLGNFSLRGSGATVDAINNTAIGTSSINGITTGDNNTAVGNSSGLNITTGSGNVLFGDQAGNNITEGSNNIILGHNIQAPVATTSNQLNIGNLIFGTDLDATGGTISSGNIGVGVQAPSTKFEVATSTASDGITISNSAATGDPTLSFVTTGGTGQTYTMGIDDDATRRFKISNSSALGTNDLFVIEQSTSDVGIGTSDPSSRLEVSSADGSDGIEITNTAADGDPILQFKTTNGTSETFTMGLDDGDGQRFKIANASSLGTATDLFTIESAGDIGIGLTNPTEKLEVNGNTRLDGNAEVTGVLLTSNGTIAADDATPNVSTANIWTTAVNTVATAITDLDVPTVGAIIHIIGGSTDAFSSTIATGGNFKLSAPWTANLNDVLILFVKADNNYIEIGRVDNL